VKKFTFSLEKVLAWRRVQVQVAEAELERLHAELRAAEASRQALGEEGTRVEQEFLHSQSATAPEFTGLAGFRQSLLEQDARLNQLCGLIAQRISAQTSAVTAKRRDLRLLEKLKEQRLHSWNEEFNKETSQLAEESYLARWKPPGS
jgi:flagellar export protein FliJ